MSVGRWNAASIVINDNILWVTGGYGGASTEYVTVTGSMIGPDLPMALYHHAMVAINSTCSMVIGGSSGVTSASTFYYDHNEGEWTTGPSLMEARDGHAAGIVTDEVTDENFVAVTGGFGSEILDSTEILQDGEWFQGKISSAIHCFYIFNYYRRSLVLCRASVPQRLINQSFYQEILRLQKFNDIGGKVLKPKKIRPPTSKKAVFYLFIF